MLTALGEYLSQVLDETGRRMVGKRLSLREAERLTGVSHNHIRAILTGVDTRTHKPFEPGPAILRKLADGLGVPYVKLLQLAGYLTDDDLPPGVLALLSNPRNAEALAEILREPGPKKLVILSGLERIAEEENKQGKPEL